MASVVGARSGPKANIEIAVRRKGETEFTKIETKPLSQRMVEKLVAMTKGEKK